MRCYGTRCSPWKPVLSAKGWIARSCGGGYYAAIHHKRPGKYVAFVEAPTGVALGIRLAWEAYFSTVGQAKQEADRQLRFVCGQPKGKR